MASSYLTTRQLISSSIASNQALCGSDKPSIEKQSCPTTAKRAFVSTSSFSESPISCRTITPHHTTQTPKQFSDDQKPKNTLSRSNFAATSLYNCNTTQLKQTNSKALHVAMMKTRFADIILKAQQTLSSNEEKKEAAKMRPEKDNFEEQRHKKKQKIERPIKDNKAAITLATNAELKGGKDKVTMRYGKEDFKERRIEKKRRIEGQIKPEKITKDMANFERKMKIEKERELARLALEKVEASVYIDDFNQTYKDFLMLISSQSDVFK